MKAKRLAVVSGIGLTATSLALTPQNLRCEYLVNPIGIGEVQPRLSWTVTSPKEGDKQTAYRIVASSTPGGRGDLWDSGVVKSDVTSQVVYEGKKLRSRQRVFWKVTVWDLASKPTTSPVASWEMGLLQKTDWVAKWITRKSEIPQVDTSAGKWIWLAEKPQENADRFFTKSITVESGKKLASAWIGVGADDTYEVQLAGKVILSGKGWASFGQKEVASLLQPGANKLAITVHNESGPAGLIVVGELRYDDGTVQKLGSDASWSASVDGQTYAKAVELDQAKAKQTWGISRWDLSAGPAPYLRKEFNVTGPIRDARLYASARGLYEIYLDGKKVGDAYFRPGDTDYDKRIQYQAYDVTPLLKRGKHVLGIVVGEGWYSGHVGMFGSHKYGDRSMGLAQLEITDAMGTKKVIATNRTWKASSGPILMNDLLNGVDYDARRELDGWSEPTYTPKGWTGVEVSPLGKVPLVAQPNESVRMLEEIKPQSIKQPTQGVYVFDLGQNMVGWAKLRVRGKAGEKITLRFAEMLNEDGTCYTTNMRGARALDTYICRGGKEEVFEPQFTFHGFRYVEVSGLSSKPNGNTITGVVVGSDSPRTGWFSCSNPMVNQLAHNIFWGQRGNYLEIPTDCPQRDERLGWMGDAQIFVRNATYNSDIAAFMTKWTQDVVDAQNADGAFPDFAPNVKERNTGAPAWGDAGVIVPWTIYQAYGDTRILQKHYKAMAKWISYIHDANPDLIWRKRMGNNYGDWLNHDADMPREVLATAYFAYDSHLMARIAEVLGKKGDAKKYQKLYRDVSAAFVKEFVSEDGTIKGDTQSCYVLALRFGLLPDSLRTAATKRLVDDIVTKRDTHLSTGFVGVGYLNPTLTENGQTDLAYKLLLNDTYPSWGYSIKYGATTIWERWDGWTKEKGFQDPGMNSFNHYSLGSVGQWMFGTIAGIDLLEPGYKRILIQPIPGGGLTWAKGAVDTINGRVETSWMIEDGKFILDVVIPTNTEAVIKLPGIILNAPSTAKKLHGREFVVSGGKYTFESTVE